jgi:hypothetical protein
MMFTDADRHLLHHIARRIEEMAINTTNLSAAAARLEADNATLISLVQTLLATNPDAGVQATLDAITQGLNTSAVSTEAELAAAGPTGATGAPTGATGASGVTGASTGPTGVTGATGA